MDDPKAIDTNKNWASVFDDFLNQPPTSSFFRLYLLCFLLWNKKIFLYLAFHNQSMWDKLQNIYEFVPFYSKYPSLNVTSMYIGPLLLILIVYLIVFWPIFKINGKNQKESFFYYLANLHHKAKRQELEKTIENIDLEKTVIEKTIKNKDLEEKGSREEEEKKWEFEYENMKDRPYMDYVLQIGRAQESYLMDKDYSFLLHQGGVYVYKNEKEEIRIPQSQLNAMEATPLNLIFVDQVEKRGYQISHQVVRPTLTSKGKFFYQKYKEEESKRGA